MGKHMATKRRHSHQFKMLRTQQEPTFCLLNSLKQRSQALFRPLATSTPHGVQHSTSLSNESSDELRQQRPWLTPPAFSSTPKQVCRPTACHVGSSTPSFKRKLPIVISQRRLQFTSNSQSFVRCSNDDSKRMTMRNVKIWLL